LTTPTPIIEGDASPLGIAAHVCKQRKQRKLNYLKLHIQSTNTKRFSPVAVDNIIRDFVFCPKILLHAAISQNPTTTLTNSYKTLRAAKHDILGPEYTEKLTRVSSPQCWV